MTDPLRSAEPRRGRLVKFAPWLTSAMIHGAVIAVVISVGAVATRVAESRPTAAAPVQARWVELPAAAAPQPTASAAPSATNRAPSTSPSFSALSPLPAAIGLAPRASQDGAVTPTPTATDGVSFGGITARQARRIAFVLDASGSMVGSFPAVAAQCRRAIESLGPGGEFVVIVFQGGGCRVAAAGRPQAANSAAAQEVADWLISEVRPGGISDPRPALELALSFHPDTLFLLANGTATGRSFGIGRAALLESAEKANAKDRFTGQRDCIVNCIECFEKDPEGALEALAAAHSGSYRFTSRPDMGLTRQGRTAP